MEPAKTPRRQTPVKKLGPDDALLQNRKRTPRNVDVDRANQVPDANWEIGTAEDQLETDQLKTKEGRKKP